MSRTDQRPHERLALQHIQGSIHRRGHHQPGRQQRRLPRDRWRRSPDIQLEEINHIGLGSYEHDLPGPGSAQRVDDK